MKNKIEYYYGKLSSSNLTHATFYLLKVTENGTSNILIKRKKL